MFVISLSSFVIQQQIWSISGRYSWQSATYFEISEVTTHRWSPTPAIIDEL
jgi:hypothetical protein